MYTGTLIIGLMETVDRVSQKADQKLTEELHEIFTMQIPVADGEATFIGAA